MKNNISALTIDVEDGINIAMRDLFNISIPPTERVVTNTEQLLKLFERKNVKATFFIMGEVAECYPSLIKSIHRKGHEIGAHGYSHLQFFRMTRMEARVDLIKAKSTIENIIGQEVIGFRAPAFSITPSTSWALDLIAEVGFQYDSSIVPKEQGRYGWPGFPKEIVTLNLTNGQSIIEIPITVYELFCKSIPVGGGGYLKFFPFILTNYFFAQIQKKRQAMVYLHPYDIDTQKYPDFFQNATSTSGFSKRLKISTFSINKHTVLNKLERLIDIYHFSSIKEIIGNLETSSMEKIKINSV